MQPLHLLLILLLILVWGFNFVIIKIGLEGIPPLFFAFVRFLLVSIPAVFFIKKPNAPFRMVASYGLLMFAVQFALLFGGMYLGVTAALASILVQTLVFFSILFGVFFLGEKVHVWQILGALVSFAGIALIGMNLGGNVRLLGFLLVVASAASWGAGSVFSKKIGNVNMASLVVWGSLIAWPPLLLLSYFVEGSDKIFYALQHLDWLSVGAVLYIAFLSTMFGYGIWSWLLHRYPLSMLSPFLLLVPIVAMLSSALVLNEPLQSWKIFAAFLVLGGLGINMFGPKIFYRR